MPGFWHVIRRITGEIENTIKIKTNDVWKQFYLSWAAVGQAWPATGFSSDVWIGLKSFKKGKGYVYGIISTLHGYFRVFDVCACQPGKVLIK